VVFCWGFGEIGCAGVVLLWWVCGGVCGKRGELMDTFSRLKIGQGLRVYFWVVGDSERRRQIQGSLHCAVHDKTVSSFGRDDVGWGRGNENGSLRECPPSRR
jgi:hypothetical protein